ncbi:hypothetical protein N7G274_002929 [Stereocaulon virgatum]|uniref:AAA+ ATPase domain-containing protein n=1 Tax=Stereocaulon virgatum TaxID=373712 RepID=A0ABR4AHM7_9LECA
MSPNLPGQRDGLRGDRLRTFFGRVLAGEQALKSFQNAKLFIEAICDQPDPVKCVERLISSPKGLSALQSALRSDVSSEFLNTSATYLLRYIQDPELKIVCRGEFLQQLILTITDPPIFWDAFVKAQRTGCLKDEALQCFSWLLLQLISLSVDKAPTYYGVARDPVIQKMLLECSQVEVRNTGQKIKHIIDAVTNPKHLDGEGPGGRHDNDFLDIKQITILPTPDELASTEPPYLRRATEIDECPESGRLAMHIDNQFRLLREDMLRDLREELQVAVGSRKGRRKGLLIDGLAIDGIECDERKSWSLRLQCLNDLSQLPNSKHDLRKKFIVENRKFLKHQSQACLIADGEIVALVTINRNEDLLAHYPPILCVQFTGSERSTSKALLGLKLAKFVQLVQLNTAIFAYEPVLGQLQNTRHLLLRDEILHWSPGRTLRSPPLLESTSIIDLVATVRSDPSCDLQQALELPKPTRLDLSQVECFMAGLTQRFSLVQGPPRTGKSFIGALIAKAIYRFSSQNILVVCYTNHALDQFLEDLLKVGIPHGSIVRLGSAGKSSTATQPLVLSAQQSNFRLKKDDWDIINLRQSEASKQADGLRNAFSNYQAKAVSKSDLLDYLEFDSETPEFFEAFILPDETNDMVKIGKKGKAVDRFYLIDRWARGWDAGSYSAAQAEFPTIWRMTYSERTAALQRWKTDILKERISRISSHGKQFGEAVANINVLFNEKNRRVVLEKRIIGCTTTAAAKHVQYIQSASPDVLLVEEAGEILESHILTALGPETGQAILIGDHKQLRPKTHHDLSIEKGDGYDLNRSLFERLVLRGFPHQVLSQQHRMRPEISSLVRHLTYPDLTDAPGTRNRPALRGFQDNLIFLNHENLEEETHDTPEWKAGNSTSSRQNNFEAQMTLKCVRYLGQQGYRTAQVVVLTPYLAQLRLLFEVLGKENDPVLNDLDSYDLVRAGLMPAATAQLQKRPLQISTIDNYQGEESDIVVASLTRSNDHHDIGFMSSPQRLNVLLSRARNALILIGNATTFLDARKGKELWREFMNLLKSGSHIYDGFPVKCERHQDRMSVLRCPGDFDQCPDGGCNEPCNVFLQCGVHICPHRCHQLFDHSKMECKHLVQSKCSVGHVQSWSCHAGKPASCRPCENKRRSKEKALQEEFVRQQRREQKQKEHAAEMTRLDEEIRMMREEIVDGQMSKEMAESIKQKKQDLADARVLAKGPSRSSVNAKGAACAQISPLTRCGENVTSACGTTEDVRESKEVGSQDEHALSPSESEWDRQKRVDNASNGAIDSLMKMTGLEEVKAQVLKIKARADTALRQNTNVKDERYGIVLLGNPGTGKTTVARLYAKFLTSMGVLSGNEFVETSGSRLANDGVAGAKKHIETLVNAGGGAFFLDEAYQLALGHSYGGASVLDFLLAEIENQVGKIVFIFAGYNKQMEKFFEHNQGFSSRMPYRLQFADYKDKELLQMLGQRIQTRYKGKMKVEGGIAGLYARIAVRRLGRGRGREGFGNARALENVLARISERQADRLHRERVAGVRPDDFLFKAEDLIGPEPSRAIIQSDAWKELQGLTGLKAVKENMQGFLDRIHTNYQRELEEKEVIDVSLNRVFIGSPGTGKTSVGKLYGQVLADMGLLSNGEVVVKNPADFVGSVLGESEKNTKAILKATEGKVLIIDEAYMLYSGGAGMSTTSDPYKTAVVDTIVAEVQSTPGEDRCVLLLGYKEKLEEMFRNTNPGLSRRFALDDAFDFEDFDDDQLREILELKLKKQCLEATEEAKDIAISMLARARHRPNFGNAGEVENMISHAKASYQTRQSAKPLSHRSADVIFEPQDFDVNFDRSANASVNCRALFKDMLGCDELVGKLEGFVQTSSNMRARGIDPREHIPFNFIFKGPPGTGKTTTARKMGQVFYDMGFLSTSDVHECSATDLVAGYVGQTGPKTIQLLEKALGKVLFVDEAYRLGEGAFAAEAINELVDSLTKPRFAGKIIVILAGYTDSMNELLRVNQGLSSRFSEEVIFTNMEPEDCWKFLQQYLEKTGIAIEGTNTPVSFSKIISLFRELTSLPSWGNGRDVQTISKLITSTTFRTAGSSTSKLTVSRRQIVDILTTFLTGRRARSVMNSSKSTRLQQDNQATQDLVERPNALKTMLSTAPTQDVSRNPSASVDEPIQVVEVSDERDTGVTDSIWDQLQADKASQELAQNSIDNAVTNAEEESRLAARESVAIAKEVKLLAAQKARDEKLQEFKRRHEEARLKELNAQRAKAEADERLRKIREDAERKRKEELRVQVKLREMGICVAGFRWIKQADGYRCAGGSHFLSNRELGI